MTPQTGMTAFIVDDNPSALTTLANDLRQQPEFAAVRTFASYAEATFPMLEEQPDVLFLDVEMPGKSGLEFLSSIKPKIKFTFQVVFYTAFSNYMIDAIRQQAFDFLLKPYKQAELRHVIDRLVQSEEENTTVKRVQTQNMPHKIAMQTVKELLLVVMEEVLMFNYESDQRSWRLHLTDGTSHVLKKGITADNLLGCCTMFVRISNTCIINLTYLAAVENTTQRCRMCPPFNHIIVTASRRYFGKLKEHLEIL